jgi:hypothetical protein
VARLGRQTKGRTNQTEVAISFQFVIQLVFQLVVLKFVVQL